MRPLGAQGASMLVGLQPQGQWETHMNVTTSQGQKDIPSLP